MDAYDVAALYEAMRRYGIPGTLVPQDPKNPEGPWRVVDHDGDGPRQDITDDVLAAVDTAARRHPHRGFVITS
ncbi:hypothetical protein HHL19_36485 [Streptomyces sp. R302]|uniref:hypothetical protein n=1 Tax=unclassified Streptomyces TaxID=2593676 RepID=UPI00145D9BC0|nr:MULTISPECIES: hypothetical protein [unclassified Streptomyces]NML55648.1 hypothetical protein [Streptomyces sp. R301]NML84010.1 hypothetical protein [Streptomyces sp. R302]